MLINSMAECPDLRNGESLFRQAQRREGESRSSCARRGGKSRHRSLWSSERDAAQGVPKNSTGK